MPRAAPQLAKFACLHCRTVMKRVPLLPTDPAQRAWPTDRAEAERFIARWGNLGLPFWRSEDHGPE